ncbi:MAG: magnesium transporter [Eubacteriales bacterium]|nr:magnesium transporter [Eubacteriales bacterium]
MDNKNEQLNQVIDKPDYSKELIGIIRSNSSPKIIKEELFDYHENDIATSLDYMSVNERKRVYRILDVDELSDIFEYVDEDKIIEYLREMDLNKRSQLVSTINADKIAEILKSVSLEDKEKILALLDTESMEDVQLITSFDDTQIGSKMTTNYISISSNLSIKDAMKELISQAADNDNISTLYVVDEKGIFYGAINLKDLIIARQDSILEDIIVTSFPFVYAKEEIDDCIEWIKDYSEDSIPALDENNRILGVITSIDVAQVVNEEMGEDYAKFAGLLAEEDLNEPLIQSVKKRIPWLMVLLGLGLIVSSVVGIFEKVVSSLTIVICFQSLILDMSGNVGTQSLAVTIRVLVNEDLTIKEKMTLVLKECKVGLINGLILGILSTILTGLYIHFIKYESWDFSYSVSLCIGASLMLAMLISSFIGTIVPIIFKKLNIDPAVASGPLITTLNDLVAVVSFYGLVWLFLIRI